MIWDISPFFFYGGTFTIKTCDCGPVANYNEILVKDICNGLVTVDLDTNSILIIFFIIFTTAYITRVAVSIFFFERDSLATGHAVTELI